MPRTPSSPITALETNSCTSPLRSSRVAKISLPASRRSIIRPGNADTLLGLGAGLQVLELRTKLFERVGTVEPVGIWVGAGVTQRCDLVEALGLLGHQTTTADVWFGGRLFVTHKGMTVLLRCA